MHKQLSQDLRWTTTGLDCMFDFTNFSWTVFFVPVGEHNKCAECDTMTLCEHGHGAWLWAWTGPELIQLAIVDVFRSFLYTQQMSRMWHCDPVRAFVLNDEIFMNRFFVPVREHSNFHTNSKTLFSLELKVRNAYFLLAWILSSERTD